MCKYICSGLWNKDSIKKLVFTCTHSELWIDEDYKQKTTVISNTNDPVWNQTFTFNLGESRKHKLYIKVMDKDKVGSDKIGDTTFDLEEAFSGAPIDTWIKLPAKLGLTSHGEIHIYMQFFPSP